MNLKEAAAYFGVSYRSIRGLIAKGFIDAKPWIRNGFLDRCTEKQRSARYVDLNRRAPGECQRCSVSNPISEASRASDLGDDQGLEFSSAPRIPSEISVQVPLESSRCYFSK